LAPVAIIQLCFPQVGRNAFTHRSGFRKEMDVDCVR
jgi:hypothetical protein